MTSLFLSCVLREVHWVAALYTTINLHQKYFHSYDTFYYNNQKGASNKFASEIFLFV